MRGATCAEYCALNCFAFQSTRPMRGATQVYAKAAVVFEFQSTRPMRGATKAVFPELPQETISIHAPHAGRDLVGGDFGGLAVISIHAPHAGRDAEGSPRKNDLFYFNPRAPCGARLRRAVNASAVIEFQSTRPMRGATRCVLQRVLRQPISIHAPHAGRDRVDRGA